MALPIVYYKNPLNLQAADGFVKAEICSCYIIFIKYILHNKVVFLFSFLLAQQPPPPPPVSRGLLRHEVSKSHTTTHYSR